MTDFDSDNSRQVFRALVDALGGDDLFAAADAHFADGVSLAQLAVWHGIPASTLHRKLSHIRGMLAKHGLLPRTWRRQKPGRSRKPGIFNTPKELF